MRPLEIARFEERDDPGYSWYVVDPDEMYPAMLDELHDIVQRNAPPVGFLDLYSQIQDCSEDDFELARMKATGLSKQDRTRREQVLETARLWFTRTLHQSVGEPLGLRILANDHWRL